MGPDDAMIELMRLSNLTNVKLDDLQTTIDQLKTVLLASTELDEGEFAGEWTEEFRLRSRVFYACNGIQITTIVKVLEDVLKEKRYDLQMYRNIEEIKNLKPRYKRADPDPLKHAAPMMIDFAGTGGSKITWRDRWTALKMRWAIRPEHAMQRFLEKRGWVVFYLEEEARKCGAMRHGGSELDCYLELYKKKVY